MGVYVAVDLTDSRPNVELREPQVFSSLAVVIEAREKSATRLAGGLATIAQVLDGGDAVLLSSSALRRLAGEHARDGAWRWGFERMLEHAAVNGWSSDGGRTVRAHCEWRCVPNRSDGLPAQQSGANAVARNGGVRTMCEAFQRTAREYSAAPALQTLHGRTITWAEYRQRSERIAGGLTALGVGRGATVATMLVNRPEFFLVDTAALLAGGTPLAVYNTSPAEEVAYIFDNAQVRVVITEPQFEAVVRRALLISEARPEVVVVTDEENGGLQGLEESCPPNFVMLEPWQQVDPQDIALIVYTSGTTGAPKGVQLTHANLLAAWRAIVGVEPRMAQLDRVISYLPAAHLADRTFSYYPAVHTGAAITCVADARQVLAALSQVRPSMFLGVPRIWEKLRDAVQRDIDDGVELDHAAKAALRSSIGLHGDALLWSGAAPIDPQVIEFFDELDLPILEGYGLSETAAVVSSNRRGDRRHGTVGPSAPGVEVELASDGEILVRGEVVMLGYRGMPNKTAEAITDDGWFRTGDIGVLDADGFLTIVDRKKELIINSAGKNMSPSNIENAVRSASHLVGAVAAIGDGRPYITALVAIDPEEAQAWSKANGLEGANHAQIAANPAIREAVEDAIARANERLARVSQIKRFVIIPDVWVPASGLVTPTLKLKRRAIATRYSHEIADLYR